MIIHRKKNTYPPPGNGIWAGLAIQSFRFEPTCYLVEGVINRINVGNARRCSKSAATIFLLLFFHELFHPGVRCREV